MSTRIKCGHCHGYHNGSREVWFCVSGPRGMVAQPAASSVREMAEGFKPEYDPWKVMTTPLEMVKNIKDGRYANRPSSEVRPKTGKKKDCLVIQTQHSDWYQDLCVIYPSGKIFMQTSKFTAIDMNLMLTCVDPVSGMRKYAEELGVCGRCGRELTDERSRYYGIGPECEKHLPEIISAVDEEKGVYRPGLD
jgi:hypothetical protein